MTHPAAALLLGLLLGGCQKLAETPEVSPPEVELHVVRMQSFQGINRVAQGTAQDMSYVRSAADVNARGADVVLMRHTGTGTEPTRLTAPKVVGNLITHGVDAMGGVSMASGNGTRVKTPSAHFDSARQRATGQEPVDVTTRQYSLSAVGFELNLRDDTFHFDKAVDAHLGGQP
jgi:hypothetical protein